MTGVQTCALPILNKRNADQRDDNKEAAKDQAELDGRQAVQPSEEPSPHGLASGFASRHCGESDIRFDPAPAEIRIPKLGQLRRPIRTAYHIAEPLRGLHRRKPAADVELAAHQSFPLPSTAEKNFELLRLGASKYPPGKAGGFRNGAAQSGYDRYEVPNKHLGTACASPIPNSRTSQRQWQVSRTTLFSSEVGRPISTGPSRNDFSCAWWLTSRRFVDERLPEMSNFCCLPGRAGGPPFGRLDSPTLSFCHRPRGR